SYSLPPVAIALGRRALEIACATLATKVTRGVTRVAESEVAQMAIGEAAAAIDVATLLLRTGRDYSTAEVSSGRRILRPRRCGPAATWSTPRIKWAGRLTGYVRSTAPVGSMTTTNWAPFAAT